MVICFATIEHHEIFGTIAQKNSTTEREPVKMKNQASLKKKIFSAPLYLFGRP